MKANPAAASAWFVVRAICFTVLAFVVVSGLLILVAALLVPAVK